MDAMKALTHAHFKRWMETYGPFPSHRPLHQLGTILQRLREAHWKRRQMRGLNLFAPCEISDGA